MNDLELALAGLFSFDWIFQVFLAEHRLEHVMRLVSYILFSTSYDMVFGIICAAFLLKWILPLLSPLF